MPFSFWNLGVGVGFCLIKTSEANRKCPRTLESLDGKPGGPGQLPQWLAIGGGSQDAGQMRAFEEAAATAAADAPMGNKVADIKRNRDFTELTAKPQKTSHPSTLARLKQRLSDPKAIGEAIVLMEILSPPVGLRKPD